MDCLFLLKDLKDIQGKNAKEEFIKKHKDNTEFLEYLYFLLNPMIVTGISNAKMNKDVGNITDISLSTVSEVLSFLIKNNTGRDTDIGVVKNSIEEILNVHEQYPRSETEEILIGLVTKSYKLGVTANTVNKVYPRFIPHFSPMLAKSIDGVKDVSKVLKNGHTETLKLDGVRCVARVENGVVELRSREGKEFKGVGDMKKQYLSSNLADGVYDGELIAIKKDESETLDELFRRTITLVNSHAETDEVEHIVFEYLTLDEWDNEKCELKYFQRRGRMEIIFDKINSETTKIKVLKTLFRERKFNEFTMKTIYESLEWATKNGFEGIMINPEDSLYTFKRGNSLFKAKEFDSADLVVLGVTEGQGRLKGTLGTVIVQYKGMNTLEVGSGFTDSERKEYFDDPTSIIGKIIEVQFQNESQDVHGNLSLRFPTFKAVREDKGLADVRFSDKQEVTVDEE